MQEILIHWAFQTVAMILTAMLIPGLRVSSIFGAFAIVVALALVNATVWDAALFFEIPYSLSSHVILLLIANGVIFWVLVMIVPGIQISGILPAILAPIVFTVINIFVSSWGREVDWAALFEQSINSIESLREYLRAQR